MTHIKRIRETDASKTIQQICQTITNSIFQPRQAVATPRQQKEKWMQKQARQYAARKTKCWITTAAEDQWETGWRMYKEGKRRQTTSTEDVNWRKLHIVHKVLVRPQSSLITQLRTGIIGLKAFLFRMKVPGVDSPECECGAPRQDAAHILECNNYEDGREQMFQSGGSRTLYTLLTTPRGAKALTNWWMQQGLQEQYKLAKDMIGELEMEAAANSQAQASEQAEA